MGKWIFAAVILFAWYVAPSLFGAMKSHDYNTAAHGFNIHENYDRAAAQNEQFEDYYSSSDSAR